MNNKSHPAGWQGDYARNDHGETESLLGCDSSCHTAYASTANAPNPSRRVDHSDWYQPQGVAPNHDGVGARISSWNEVFIAHLPERLERRKSVFWLAAATCFLLGWFMKGAASSFFPDISDPVVRDRIRSNWEKEYQRHELRLDRMQDVAVKWAEEIRAHDTARLAMQSERTSWDIERKKWEKEHEEREKILLAERQLELERKKREEAREREKEDRERAGIKWVEPQPEPHCLRYGARKWTAKLDNVPAGYDPILICRKTKALIHGRWVLPDSCENQGAWSGTIGTWYVDFDEASCHTFWAPIKDKGCTSEGSGRRRIDAHLENLRPGDNGMSMCSSTPAEFHGLKFDGPHSCEDWGRWGYGGVWFIEDGSCR